MVKLLSLRKVLLCYMNISTALRYISSRYCSQQLATYTTRCLPITASVWTLLWRVPMRKRSHISEQLSVTAYVPPVLHSATPHFALTVYFHYLRLSVYAPFISLKYQQIYFCLLVTLCFLWGVNWILTYYLEEFRPFKFWPISCLNWNRR